mmetsp:Transcript_119972/g.344858  ORF Transcript_119972/g.344858 Transcript_119972/m.344858 type:complete len:813 (-) Transcript_119972:136-2574(-)
MAGDPVPSPVVAHSDSSTDADSGDNVPSNDNPRGVRHPRSTGVAQLSANVVLLRGGSSAHGGKHRSAGNEDRHHKWLNRQITAAADTGDMEWLLQVIESNLPDMNLINFSTAVHRTAKLALGCSPAKREQYMTHPSMMSLKRAVLDCVTSSISPDGTWLRTRRPEDQASEMRCLSIICWSCATIRIREESLFQRAAAASKHRLHEMKPFELSNMLWSFAKLSLGDPAFFNALAPHLLKRREGEFSSQCLSTIVWAFGTVKAHNHAIFTSFARELAAAAPTMATQGIANTAWAFARVRRQEGPLFRALAEVACKEHVAATFKPQELSNTVWAFATVGLQHPQLFSCLADVSINRRWELPPQNIANMLWAYAKLAAPRRERLFPALLEVTSTRLELYKPQEVSAILWAAAREIAGGGASPSCRGLFYEVPKHFAHRLPDFTSQAMACMAEAFTLAEVENIPFFELIVQESLRRLPTFQPPSLCTLFRGLVLCMQKQPEGNSSLQNLETLGKHVLSRLGEMQPHNNLHLVQSLDLLPKESTTGAVLSLSEAPQLANLQRTPLPPARLHSAAGGAAPEAAEELLDPMGCIAGDDDAGFPGGPSTHPRPPPYGPPPPPSQQRQQTSAQQPQSARTSGTGGRRRRQRKTQEAGAAGETPPANSLQGAGPLPPRQQETRQDAHQNPYALTASSSAYTRATSADADLSDFRLPPGLDVLRHLGESDTSFGSEPLRVVQKPEPPAIPMSRFFSAPAKTEGSLSQARDNDGQSKDGEHMPSYDLWSTSATGTSVASGKPDFGGAVWGGGADAVGLFVWPTQV